jgi:hypothetical protein
VGGSGQSALVRQALVRSLTPFGKPEAQAIKKLTSLTRSAAEGRGDASETSAGRRGIDLTA